MNAWPLDEGLIDYVDTGRHGEVSDMNRLYTANVIAHEALTFGGRTIDASSITPALLSGDLHEADNLEANVAIGYHAIEFLLWGQDLNGTGPGAGDRPHTDFDPSNCTGGNCERRTEYLTAASALLIAALVATARPGESALRFFDAPEPVLMRMAQYCGSAAFDRAGTILGVSSPRGDLFTFWSLDGALLATASVSDGCGIAADTRPGRGSSCRAG